MKFQPRTRDEIEQENPYALAPDGIYEFEVRKAIDKTSEAGNEMIEAHLRVFSADREYTVFDYLTEKMARKLVDFCDATGLASKYRLGEIDAQTIEGRNGKVKLRTEKPRGNYRAKNIVLQYIPRDVAEMPSPTRTPKPAFTPAKETDSEIPF